LLTEEVERNHGGIDARRARVQRDLLRDAETDERADGGGDHERANCEDE